MLARRWHDIVNGGSKGSVMGHWFDGIIGAVVLLSTLATVLSTEPRAADWSLTFVIAERACAAVFALEYCLRAWVAPMGVTPGLRRPARDRLAYIVSPLGLIDLLSLVPLVATPLGEALGGDVVLMLRCAPLLKLLRYFSAFDTLAHVVRNERKPLLAAGTLMLILLVLLSTGGYLLEREAQPGRFGSVVQALWWGIVTLSTVGYGDVAPVTAAGRVLGGVAVVMGMGMFALPAGILATGFAEEMRRRNFVVTWSIVARVPFFEHLPALRIAEIVELLESRTAARGETLIIKNDPADSMYFLIEGEVEVILPARKIVLHTGDFFGELALISNQPRSATVVAKGFCQLLRLRVDHFHRLMAAHPDLAAEMRAVAERRAGAGIMVAAVPRAAGGDAAGDGPW